MPANLLGTFTLNFSAALTPTNPVNNGAAPGPAIQRTQKFTEGVAAGQADTAYGKRFTVPAGSNVELEVANNDGDPDGNGDAVDLDRIIKIVVAGQPGQLGKFIVGGAVGSAFSAPFNNVAASVVVVGADDSITLGNSDVTGYATAAGQMLKIANPGGAAVVVDVQVMGS